jgi:hypothetical protein
MTKNKILKAGKRKNNSQKFEMLQKMVLQKLTKK